jgi:ABC-type bacteriocin/lantibiotic exporter with double-glycine peptidase domain
MNHDVKRQAQWFARQLQPLWKAHLLSVSLMVLSSLMFLLDPLLIKWLIDKVLPRRNLHLLFFAAAGFFVIYIGRLGFSSLARLVSFRSVQNLVFRIRLSLLEKMNQLSADYHEKTPLGEKLFRLEQDVDELAELGSSLVPYVLQTTFNSVFVVGVMCALNWRLTCVVLPLLPMFFVFRNYFQGRLRESSDRAQQESSRESSFLQEHLTSLIQIQLLNQERNQTSAFRDRAKGRIEAVNRRTLVEIWFSTCYMMIIALGTITILGYGGYQVFMGALTIGGLVAFYSYLARLFDPLNAAVEVYSRLNRMSANMRRILEVLETTPSVRESPNAMTIPVPMRGTVEIKNVCFAYRAELDVLRGVDLRIEAGERVALVGINGSGKSTIAKLIARVYDVNQGAVFIEGVDVRNLRLEDIRTKISYLMQDVVLFDRTLKENLLLGKPSATPDELRGAIEVACLEDVVERLPSGWDTALGPGGNMLSGGERQRVALARAVLSSPSLLLLDEATSEVDAPAERKIFANLSQRFSSATFVLISHRLEALQWVDRIVVLDQGQISQQGTHEELAATCNLYVQLRSAVSTSGMNLSRSPVPLNLQSQGSMP